MAFFGDKVCRPMGHRTVMIAAGNAQVNEVIYRNKHYSSEKMTVRRFRNITNKNVLWAVTVAVSFIIRKSDEVTGEWRKLHNEELNDLHVYSLPSIVRVVKSRRMRWAGHVARMEEEREVHRVVVGKPDGNGPLGRPRPRWENNIKMDLQEAGGVGGDWIELAQDRNRWRAFVSTVKNLRVPYK
jgi:hypothetical protein